MKLKINGELKSIDADQRDISLSIVINKLGLNPKLIVVEFNGIIINRAQWESQSVKDGDVLEIVTIVGGGA